ncbi:hypothetical protein D3C83_174250 [compost metagenome]
MWGRMTNANTGITEWQSGSLPPGVFNAEPGKWLLARHNDAAHLHELAPSD